MQKNKTQVALATIGFALAIHGSLACADGPESAYENGAPVQSQVDPRVYQVNADGAQEDADHRMSDVARAYRNGYINRGKADDALMKQKLAEQHAADMAQVQRAPASLGYPSEPPPPPAYLPPPPPPGYAAVPPGYPAVPPDYAPPVPYDTSGYAQPVYVAPPAVVQQVYAPPVQYVSAYPYTNYAGAQPVISVGAMWGGGGYRGYSGWGGGWGGGWGRARWR